MAHLLPDRLDEVDFFAPGRRFNLLEPIVQEHGCCLGIFVEDGGDGEWKYKFI